MTEKGVLPVMQFAICVLLCIVCFSVFATTTRAADQPDAEGAFSAEISDAIEASFGADLLNRQRGQEQTDALGIIAQSKDQRLAWIISDLMRIVTDYQFGIALGAAASKLLEVEFDGVSAWHSLTNKLIALDIPAPPGYLSVKRRIYTLIGPKWERLFVPGFIDWRHVSWGGVHIDDRPFGTTDSPCNCIPAADNPKFSNVDKAGWLDDDAVVFGIAVNCEYRAYPRQVMEVREMVNDTLGGRHLGIPYCTLCGSAQAYFTDDLPAGVERSVLRTSGLLIRSNKVMFDVNTFSVFDTFLGEAVTGPLAQAGVKLNQVSVVTTTWEEWKIAHPDTTVLVDALALGRDFDFRNNRDTDGPIFPIGDLDPRSAVQEDVLGVVTLSGAAVAFVVRTARTALLRGEAIAFANVQLKLDGGGVKAVDGNGDDVGSPQAFWFAWSQFHPNTALWHAN